MPGKLSRQIALPENTNEEISRFLQGTPPAMFQIREIREAFTMMRLQSVDPEAIELADSVAPSAIDNVVEYNLEMLQNISQHQQTLRRPDLLINALKSIYYVSIHAAKLSVLCIGPRTEVEFFSFIGSGFSPENLTGLDLMSYSDFVEVGDMHHMPFPDDKFDIVFVGWTLTYSRDLQTVANECRRVAKPGGYIAIGVESDGKNRKDPLLGYKLEDSINIQRTDEIIDLFGDHVHAVPFRHEVHRSMQDSIDMVMAIIELK